MNRETELSLLLGMAHGLANSFSSNFNSSQQKVMNKIEAGIIRLFYPQTDTMRPGHGMTQCRHGVYTEYKHCLDCPTKDV